MVNVGRSNTLIVSGKTEQGLLLDDTQGGEILLPARFVVEDCEVGSSIEVFIYLNSEDQLAATTEVPFVQVGQFEVLRVVAVESIGAFLDWGLQKDLFLPFAEQIRELRVGQSIVVFVYLDKSSRISASMRVDRNIQKEIASLEENQEVDLIVFGQTDLGYKAIINNLYLGMLYENEVFENLQYAQKTKGYIRKIRDDGKIDLGLQKTGHQAGTELEPLILKELEKNQGFLPINDKTSADLIYEMFSVSKKKYKIALGGLYKKRLIIISDDGIRLTEDTDKLS